VAGHGAEVVDVTSGGNGIVDPVGAGKIDEPSRPTADTTKELPGHVGRPSVTVKPAFQPEKVSVGSCRSLHDGMFAAVVVWKYTTAL
jgi:hypothetical protein